MKLGLKRLTIILLVISLISITACSKEELKDVNEVFNEFEANYLIINHGRANYYKGNEESLTDNFELMQLMDNENVSYYDSLSQSLEYLNKYKISELEEVDRVTMETMKWYLQTEIEGEKYRNYNFSANDWTGTGIDLGSYLINNYKIENKADAEGYLVFLSKIDNQFDRIIADLQEGEKQGIIPSRKSLDDFIYFAGPLTRKIVQFSDFYENFKNKVEKLSDIDEEEKEELIKKVEEVITITVNPAYERLRKYALELRKKSTETSSAIWEHKNGDEYYEYLLKKITSTNYTPEEVHEMALKEVERIKEEIMKILKENEEYKDVSFEEFIDIEAETYSVEEAKKEYKLIVGELKEKLSEMFDTIPEADVEVEMYEDPNTVSRYYSRSFDGSIKPKIYFNLGYILVIKSMKYVVYHEGIPGHHFQFTLEIENKDIPDFKRIMPFGGYIEGWAKYAETLPVEYGLVDNPKDKLQLLYNELRSAVNTVCDTGIHYKRWTKSQAEEYIKKYRNPKTQVSYDFFINNPCDQIKYFVGLVKMRELRKRAEEQLGEKFDIKEFHSVILENGRMPLIVLEKQVDDYIKAKK